MAGPIDDQDDAVTAAWHALLTGTDPSLKRLRRVWHRVPSAPRCKVCAAPFSGPGRLIARVVMGGRATTNPLVCKACFGSLRKQAGGAEVPLSVLFADVRGSTGIAERIGPAEYTHLLHLFYAVAARAIERADGIVDKFLGDGVMALFIPVIAGADHAGRAIHAGRQLLADAERQDLTSAGLRIGAGVHSGVAFAGAIGSGDRLDFSALGDTVNVAARLGSVAGAGELLVSLSALDASGETGRAVETRKIEIAGRAEPLDVAAFGSAEARASS
jgi:adenylate cyclase